MANRDRNGCLDLVWLLTDQLHVAQDVLYLLPKLLRSCISFAYLVQDQLNLLSDTFLTVPE